MSPYNSTQKHPPSSVSRYLASQNGKKAGQLAHGTQGISLQVSSPWNYGWKRRCTAGRRCVHTQRVYGQSDIALSKVCISKDQLYLLYWGASWYGLVYELLSEELLFKGVGLMIHLPKLPTIYIINMNYKSIFILALLFVVIHPLTMQLTSPQTCLELKTEEP